MLLSPRPTHTNTVHSACVEVEVGFHVKRESSPYWLFLHHKVLLSCLKTFVVSLPCVLQFADNTCLCVILCCRTPHRAALPDVMVPMARDWSLVAF